MNGKNIDNGTSDDLRELRHTASHVMAQAVKRIFPDTKLAIGPATATGFYYDFDIDRRLSDSDLLDITKEMKRIVKENLQLKRIFVVQIITPLAKVFLTLRID